MTRWLVTGAGGMLGLDLVDLLRAHGRHEVDARPRTQLDLLDASAVAAAVRGASVVVNCAAWTDVDGAESDEAAATRVNGDGVGVLALACAAAGARLLHLSTDYVFPGAAVVDGVPTTPYAEDAPTAPLNAYGRSKLAGERAVLEGHPSDGYVVRTAWLYATHGRNFVTTMARLARERDTVDVVDDQRGQPTWTCDLADLLVRLGESDAPPGVYHGTSSGEGTWYDLARETFRLLGHDPDRVRRTTSEAYVRPAKRPAFSVLGHDRWAKAGLEPIRDWREGLRAWSEAYRAG